MKGGALVDEEEERRVDDLPSTIGRDLHFVSDSYLGCFQSDSDDRSFKRWSTVRGFPETLSIVQSPKAVSTKRKKKKNGIANRYCSRTLVST